MEQDRASVIWYSRSGHLQGTSLCTFLPDLDHQKRPAACRQGSYEGDTGPPLYLPPILSNVPSPSPHSRQDNFVSTTSFSPPPPPATPGQEDCDNVALSKARALLHHHPLSPHPVALFVAMLPTVEKAPGVSLLSRIPSAAYVLNWIFFSTIVIIFNKKIISSWGFPVLLTCWHLIFATILTQILARTSTILDGRKSVRMTGKVYFRAIVPIGVLYSLSLVCSNLTYLYLSVAFIQMLKAAAPASVLFVGYAFGTDKYDLKILINICVIVFGVGLASYGEIDFSLIGFLYQLGGLIFESIRLIMVQKLLTGTADDPNSYKMDPLVSLYYYAPVCAVMNIFVALVVEVPTFKMADLAQVGPLVLLANAGCAFLLNVASVFLIGKTSSLVLTLCGVIKNVGIVVLSVILWGTIVSGLQWIGYSIASAALIYYSLGWEGIKNALSQGQTMWESRGMNLRGKNLTVIAAVGVITTFLLVVWWSGRTAV
ncbi:hypothetical protein V494_02369 [Pseudogymnoascus sp. VKM F-4513 (FW-928)]|nr:hypothetical protein V494_02369 [Pseudogymnoascus sp. VKM F-4513 (FW-928)]